MLILFNALLILGAIILLLKLIVSFTENLNLRKFEKNKIINSILKSILDTFELFTSVKFLVYILIIISVFTFFSFFPYLQNLNDKAIIISTENNIQLYNSYTERYAEAARQQIEDYAEMQQEMARRATLEQLQFWSEQQDEIGNKLSETIREYSNKIENMELIINEKKASIEIRTNNKWYFYLDE